MNLHQLANPAISVVNANTRVLARVSRGEVDNEDGTREALYETPCTVIASIAGNTLSVSTTARGRVAVGQTVTDRSGLVLPGTIVTARVAPDTYLVNRAQDVAAMMMSTELVLQAQVQPTTWRDIQMLEGLNIEGVRWKAYLFGEINGLVRGERRGGDLIVIPPGNIHAGTWLVAQVLEQFPTWVSAAITLQNQESGQTEEN